MVGHALVIVVLLVVHMVHAMQTVDAWTTTTPAQPTSVAASDNSASGARTPGVPAIGLSPRNANYRIDVRLEPTTRRLTGRQVLTWQNPSALTASELRFHLYYNAWRNGRSTWMRELELAIGPRAHSRRPDEWGGIDVTAVRLLTDGDAVELGTRTRFAAPDDGNEHDRTVMVVPLPRTVAPGEVVRIEMEWRSRIPRTFARTGAVGDFFFIAQWFPKIGVLEWTGWNCHQFHSSTEFFADFGVYDVRIRVPIGWVVGATGIEQERTDHPDGTTTHRYHQEDVHDFAWTTSPDYVERTARFEKPGLPAVDMRLLLQPEHTDQAERHFAATRAALAHYGEWFGPYPYGDITIVDPAWQSGAGGMEYPTLLTAGTRWLAPATVSRPERVTIHETGHQFWYGIVANDEVEDAWLDEGLNTFSSARVLAASGHPDYHETRFFGGFIPWTFRGLPRSRATDGNRLDLYRTAAELDIPSRPSFLYWPASADGISYAKTALWLHTLERYLGWEVLRTGLSTFFQRWQFHHPRPQDFFDALAEASGQDLAWFFDQVYRGDETFDYGVQELSSRRRAEAGRLDDEAYPAPEDEATRYRTSLVVRRYGEAVFPVEILTRFRNGQEVREHWDGRARWKRFAYASETAALSAQVDPERVLLLDLNRTNNSVTLEPRATEAAARWSLTWMVWLQDLLMTYAFFF